MSPWEPLAESLAGFRAMRGCQREERKQKGQENYLASCHRELTGDPFLCNEWISHTKVKAV